MNAKPCSAACERNREPILAVLREHFADRSRVLEIGSGTGQHAVYFAEVLPHLTWQASDRAENLSGIRLWLEETKLANMPAPIAFDINDKTCPAGGYDALFTANTLHIMAWPEVVRLFAGMDSLTGDDAKVIVYGPFNYDDSFTSASNAAFDASLRAAAAHMGIRDFEAVDELAQGVGLNLVVDIAMPANNRCLVWRRGGKKQGNSDQFVRELIRDGKSGTGPDLPHVESSTRALDSRRCIRAPHGSSE